MEAVSGRHYQMCLAIHTYGNLQIASGDGLYISTLLTVRSCTIMYCTYMYVFSVNKILFKPKVGLQCPVEQMFLTVYLVYCLPEFIALFST